MHCQSCGADNPPTETQCAHCGSHLPASGQRARAATFARINASQEYLNRNSPERIARLPKIEQLQKAMLFAVMAVFIGGSAMMVVFLLVAVGMFGAFGMRVGGAGALFALGPLVMIAVPVGFVVLGIFLFRQMQKKMSAMESGPVEALPVVVVDKRTHVAHSGSNGSTNSSYFVTCEQEDGSRQEYQVWDGKMYGRLAADDAGVIFIRGGYGVDFDRIAT